MVKGKVQNSEARNEEKAFPLMHYSILPSIRLF